MAALCCAFVRDSGRDLIQAAVFERRAGFTVVERRASPGELVAHREPTGRLAVFCYPDRAAVVLGSTQVASSVDAKAAAAIDAVVVRRRSGGGAVFVAPRAQVWLDLFVPAGDPLFRTDVSRAAGFVGELWQASLLAAEGGSRHYEVYAGPLVASPWSRVWCFSGLGPGEVTSDGRKLVGVSQRRSRAGAWFFTMACVELDPSRDASFVEGTAAARNGLEAELTARQTHLECSFEVVEARLRERLSSL